MRAGGGLRFERGTVISPFKDRMCSNGLLSNYIVQREKRRKKVNNG